MTTTVDGSITAKTDYIFWDAWGDGSRQTHTEGQVPILVASSASSTNAISIFSNIPAAGVYTSTVIAKARSIYK